MTLKTVQKTSNILNFENYNGSLDFPCDFCNSNSYNNYHFTKNGVLELVVCKDCLKKMIDNKRYDENGKNPYCNNQNA